MPAFPLDLRFAGTKAGSLSGEVATIVPSPQAERSWCLIGPQRQEMSAIGVRAALERLSVKIRGAAPDLLAEPCLLRAAEIVRRELAIATLGEALNLVTCLVAHVLLSPVAEGACSHSVVIDDFLCTTLVLAALDPAEDEVAGLCGVAEIVPPLLMLPALPADLLPVGLTFLEAAADEPVLSVDELDRLESWQTLTCETPRRRWPWQHLIFVSHRWPTGDCPGTPQDLAAIKELVASYIDRALNEDRGSANPRIKATKREDFGVWIDYMMVPNSPRHGERDDDCARCLGMKTDAIKRINALLTLATVLLYTPGAEHRGWILQEVSLNAHPDPAETNRIAHRDRIRLMQQDVEFTDPVDGVRLRCYEFVRLGQMPRVWPSVNLELVRRLVEEGQVDEGSAEARPTLMEHARAFDKRCHLLKRVMAEVSQAVAIASTEDVIDLSALVDSVDRQAEDMGALQRLIAANDFLDAPSDPSGLLAGEMSVQARATPTRSLQLQQFVTVAMGLRAEWRRGAGFGSWIRLTTLTEALTGTKFMVRLKQGRVVVSEATSGVRLRRGSPPDGARALRVCLGGCERRCTSRGPGRSHSRSSVLGTL